MKRLWGCGRVKIFLIELKWVTSCSGVISSILVFLAFLSVIPARISYVEGHIRTTVQKVTFPLHGGRQRDRGREAGHVWMDGYTPPGVCSTHCSSVQLHCSPPAVGKAISPADKPCLHPAPCSGFTAHDQSLWTSSGSHKTQVTIRVGELCIVNKPPEALQGGQELKKEKHRQKQASNLLWDHSHSFDYFWAWGYINLVFI